MGLIHHNLRRILFRISNLFSDPDYNARLMFNLLYMYNSKFRRALKQLNLLPNKIQDYASFVTLLAKFADIGSIISGEELYIENYGAYIHPHYIEHPNKILATLRSTGTTGTPKFVAVGKLEIIRVPLVYLDILKYKTASEDMDTLVEKTFEEVKSLGRVLYIMLFPDVYWAASNIISREVSENTLRIYGVKKYFITRNLPTQADFYSRDLDDLLETYPLFAISGPTNRIISFLRALEYKGKDIRHLRIIGGGGEKFREEDIRLISRYPLRIGISEYAATENMAIGSNFVDMERNPKELSEIILSGKYNAVVLAKIKGEKEIVEYIPLLPRHRNISKKERFLALFTPLYPMRLQMLYGPPAMLLYNYNLGDYFIGIEELADYYFKVQNVERTKYIKKVANALINVDELKSRIDALIPYPSELYVDRYNVIITIYTTHELSSNDYKNLILNKVIKPHFDELYYVISRGWANFSVRVVHETPAFLSNPTAWKRRIEVAT